MEKYLNTYSVTDAYDTLGRYGKVLSSDPYNYSGSGSVFGSKEANDIAGIAILIIRIILSIIFKAHF